MKKARFPTSRQVKLLYFQRFWRPKKNPTKTPPGHHLGNPVLHLAHDVPRNRLVLAGILCLKRCWQLHQHRQHNSFLHKKNISSPKLETSSHVSQKKTQKPLKTRSRLAAPQRFPCPSRGTNCPIHLCRWRCQLPGQGQVFNQQTPLFKLEKSPKRKAKKKDHLPNLSNNHPIFQGQQNLPTFRGEFPVFSAHPWGGHPKVKAFPRGLHFRELGPTVQPGRKRLSKESF